LVGVLKGCFVFFADLVRELTIPFEVDFVCARFCSAETSSAENVDILKDIECHLSDRHVIVVEDIADKGLALETVVAQPQDRGCASVRRCALLVREGCVPPDFVGLQLGPGFVVGYGLDYAEQYRGLREIRAPAEGENSD
jgi:hypoxanthine phosphoribosyltransferase